MGSRHARRELESEQGAQRENMIRITSAIRVVTNGNDLALVIEQAIQDMQRLAGRRRDHLGVERGITVGHMSVKFAAGLPAHIEDRISSRAGGSICAKIYGKSPGQRMPTVKFGVLADNAVRWARAS